MSTLVPGSEPWKIAEPLEYAADIWKALEEKYGPKSEGAKHDGLFDVYEDDDGDQEGEEADGEGGWEDSLAGDQPTRNNDGLAQEVSDGLQEVAELWTRGQEGEVAKRNADGARKTKPTSCWSDDLMRDQRFLWAVLNGGKEEELGIGQPSATGARAVKSAG
jgi:hypothetical protein